MKIAIHPDQIGKQSYSEKWIEFLDKYQVKHDLIDLISISNFSELKKYDAVMWRWGLKLPDRIIAPKVFDILANDLNIQVYPEYNMISTWEDKIKQHFLFNSYNIPTALTWIFFNMENAVNWADEAKYPVIFKLSTGASAAGVAKVENKQQANYLIKHMFLNGVTKLDNLIEIKNNKRAKPIARNIKNRIFKDEHLAKIKYSSFTEKNYAYFQEFLPDNKNDTRVTVIGDRAFAYRRFNRPDDFRASGSGNFNTDPKEIDLNIVTLAFEISEKLSVHCMAYDFLINKEGKPVLMEMCWTFVDWMVQSCPGHWNKKLEWQEGKMWPEEAQVIDIINKLKAK